MSTNNDVDKQKGFEYFLLLVLGANTEKISMLHLEKEAFLLWNFDPSIKAFLHFIAHFRGPFSKDLEETIRNPYYCDSCWQYYPPDARDQLSGGFVELTNKGKKNYQIIYSSCQQSKEAHKLLAGIQMVRRVYDELSCEELLLLIYDTYPGYSKKSIVLDQIDKRRIKLAEQLLKKGVIDEDRYQDLIASP